jgi:hypothetical protein
LSAPAVKAVWLPPPWQAMAMRHGEAWLRLELVTM